MRRSTPFYVLLADQHEDAEVQSRARPDVADKPLALGRLGIEIAREELSSQVLRIEHQESLRTGVRRTQAPRALI